MSSQAGPTGGDPYAAGAGGAPEEDEQLRAQRAAYEAELARITVPDMLMQATVSLLNLAARRLVPEPPAAGSGGEPGAPGAQAGAAEAGTSGGVDLEQVRDAIDGVRALLEILERRMPGELRPLRDALSQLQLAYATEIRKGGGGQPAPPQSGGTGGGAEGEGGAGGGGEEGDGAGGAPKPGGEPSQPGGAGQEQRRPGPAESSGRLWVPGR